MENLPTEYGGKSELVFDAEPYLDADIYLNHDGSPEAMAALPLYH